LQPSSEAFEGGEGPAELISWFGNKYDLTPAERKLGFIEYNGGLSVRSSLLNVVLPTNGQIISTPPLLPAGNFFRSGQS
jgi:hypothetical protein